MTLLQAGVDTSVIALWLGHAGVRSTDPYVHADITIKEKALALTTPAIGHSPAATGHPTRSSRSSRACNYAEKPNLDSLPTAPRHAPRHSRGVGIGRPMRISA